MSKKDFNGLNNVDLGKLNIKNFELPTYDLSYSLNRINEVMRESERAAIKAAEEREQYRQDILTTLKNIEGNTANLITLINLIQSNNDKQEEILEIVTELLTLAKEKDIEVINNKYRKIMNRITTFTEDINTINTLTSFGIIILNIIRAKLGA